MRKVFVFNVFDKVSESWLGNFFANTYNQAILIFKKFIDNKNLNWHDFSLYMVAVFDSPLSSDCLDKFEPVDFSADFETLDLEVKDDKVS